MVRTRFAPSPTGYLHIGGARTALFCWLFARRHGGKFILRIEDTDAERSTKESIDAILESMTWLGLDYDEGPFYQTKRFDRYAVVLQNLLQQGKAYKCYCSKERLAKLREQQTANKQKPRYDGRCRDLAAIHEKENKPFVVRFRNPVDDEVKFADIVRGEVVFQNRELDDLIIARSDGTPTYNFTVVVDDLDMKITHVIRGEDHINNTPRQINIIKALGAEPPLYGHVPMILGEDGKRLSKRHGAVSVMQYRNDGFLPEALLNYLVRLGWSYKDQEVFSRKEMIALFAAENINKSATIFNPSKLIWLNQYYLKNCDVDYVAKQLSWHMHQLGIEIAHGPVLTEVVKAQCERSKTLDEMAEKSRFFYQDVHAYDEAAAKKNLKLTALDALQQVRDKLAGLSEWTDVAIHQVIIYVAEKLELKLGKVAQPIRVAVTGNTISPPIDITLRLLGQEKVITRLDKAIDFIREHQADIE